jgi:dTDP-4-dehydrorhamnose 3,5-epimerase
VNRLYDYTNPDELRKSWNDHTIVPKLINGKKDDFRVGKPWDWLLPPHK